VHQPRALAAAHQHAELGATNKVAQPLGHARLVAAITTVLERAGALP
jgi:hypothetical protein